MGRHSSYTTELADEIVDRLSEGEPLRRICRDEHMPSWRTFYDWVEARPDFAARITRARELGEDSIAQECFDIADNAANDWMIRNGMDDEPSWSVNGEHIQRSKLRIETRLKLLAKWNPKKWGEKVTQTVEGGEKPLQVENIGDLDLARRIAFALEKGDRARAKE